MTRLPGRAVLIAGHFHPLALASAALLKAEGAEVFLAGQSSTSDPLFPFSPVDLDDPGKLTSQINALPEFGGALLFPGWYGHGEFLASTANDWSTALNQNFYRMVYVGQAVAKRLIAQNTAGTLVYIASTAGLRPVIETVVQGTTFTMLEALIKMAAVDLAAHGITVNMIAHGWLRLGTSDVFPTARQAIGQDVPLARPGIAQDVVELATFLMSGSASHITGAVIPVDGGALLTKSEAASPYRANADKSV